MEQTDSSEERKNWEETSWRFKKAFTSLLNNNRGLSLQISLKKKKKSHSPVQEINDNSFACTWITYTFSNRPKQQACVLCFCQRKKQIYPYSWTVCSKVSVHDFVVGKTYLYFCVISLSHCHNQKHGISFSLLCRGTTLLTLQFQKLL